MWSEDKSRRRFLMLLLFFGVCCLSAVSGFSDGSKLAKGSAATRKLYCNRQPSRRAPLHFHPSCNGYCEPRSDFDQFYNMTITNATYWLDVVRVNISAKPQSGKSLTGFSIYAIDDSGHVAGSFVEDDTDVVVGTCNDIIQITDETHAGFHKMANHSRKNVSIQWQPDGYNHGKVKFVLWVVNNHSDIYTVESQWLTSQKHGSDTLDVKTTLDKVASAIDIKMFEDSFKYRSMKGYNLDLTNPFSDFSKSPSKNDLVPANVTGSNNGSDLESGNSPVVTSQPGGSGSNVSSGLGVGASNGTSGVNNGSVLGNIDMSAVTVNNASDTKLSNVSENKLNNMNETNMVDGNGTRIYNVNDTSSMNDTNVVGMNDTNIVGMNDTNIGNVNNTNLYNMNGSNIGNMSNSNTSNLNETNIRNVNNTNLYSMNDTNNVNGTNMDKVNNTSLNNTSGAYTINANDTIPYSMNETNTGNLNDTNPYNVMDPDVNSMNDTIVRNLTLTPANKDSQSTQQEDTTKLNIPYTTQLPGFGTNGSQLTEPGNNTELNATATPDSMTSYPNLSDSQTTTSGNINVSTSTNDLEQSGSQNGTGVDNNIALNKFDNTSGVTPSSGTIVASPGTTVDDDGYPTTTYPETLATDRMNISTASPVPSDRPGGNTTEVLRPAAM